MAVQAQYPSNVLLLNSRNGQEGPDDYSLLLQSQQQPPLFDQTPPHMLLFNNNNNGAHSPKRGTEATNTTSSSSPNTVIFNQISLQSHSPQLLDLTQLHHHHHHHQQNVVSTGLKLSFDEPQQRLLFHHHHQQQQQIPQYHSSSAFSSLLSEHMASQIKQQRDEITQFFQAQGEQLRRGLAEKRQKHFRELLSIAEESLLRRLREKEAEVEKATRRYAELEARAAQLSVEAQAWQAKAKAQEATAVSLQAQLHHAIMSGGQESGVLSCAEDAESAYVDPERVVVSGPKCRGCGKRVASVVVLPCRHLCVCTECDAHFRACPVCLTVKNSTVEVYLS